MSSGNGVALYLRVSTEDQDLSGQERELREYAARRGWPVGCVFAEKTTATGKVERTAWEQLRAEACLPMTRRFERVLVWSLDRWSRDPSFVKAVGSIEDLEVLGIRFHSLREPALDSSEDGVANLGRDLLRGILPTIAAFEARRRSERTLLAMQEIKAGRRKTRSGRPPGRQPRVTEYKRQSILKFREQGLTWPRVAEKVGLPAGTCASVHSLSVRGLWKPRSFPKVTPSDGPG
jgi:DNA invertase Pin-like site-specific DNA recombinase